KAKSPSDPSEVARIEAQQLKIVLRRSRQQTHISQLGGSSIDEGTGLKPRVPDVPTDESEEEISWNSSDDEGDDAQEKGREIQATLDVEDSHVTLTPVHPDGQQESSSVSSQFVTSMLNPPSDAGMESIFATASSPVAPLQTSTPIMTPSTIATITTISHAPIPPTTIPSEVLQNLPTFDSVFRFEDRLKSLEANFSEYIQTNSFAEAVSNISGIVHQYMNQQMTEARIIKEQVKIQVKEQVSRILPRIEQSVNAQLEAEVLTRLSHSSRTSYAVVVDLSEIELKKILIEKMEGNKSIQRSDEQRNLYKVLVDAYEADKIILDSYRETVILKRRHDDDDDDQDEGPSAGSDRGSKRQREGADDQTIVQSSQHSEWFSQPKKPPISDRDWNKTLPAIQGSTQTWKSELAKQVDSRSSFNELLDTPLDFFNFIMNRLRVDTLTLELLAEPTFELIKGSCTSLIELEYHLEEVYKATTDQLDWVNPQGQQYPHNLLQPLPLIPDNRGRRVIPFEHFINNDLKYLRGGASSHKYTTSVTKTKAADYENIKWIKDLIPRSMRIIAVTNLKIVEWHSYKHLDWITVRRDDNKLYKFKEGDFKRLRLQDIEDMLLLLVQGKLTNLTVEERFAFNVSLRMFTRSIVIQRRVEDLQLGVESYQKRLNLTKPDTYRSDLKQREAYTAYSNPRGFIYQNKDKKNMLMWIDELHKFSNGTLNDVRNALDDRLKGIRM
nr:hypothetical protein [Tanacetum cinerariifolium]